MSGLVKGALCVLCAAVVMPLLLVLVAVVGDHTQACGAGAITQPGASSAASAIPSNYLDLYQQAGRRYGIAWVVLAGIGQIESDHGRSDLPGVHSGTNSFGAAGPMQFLGSTWRQYGNGGDIYDPRDAIPAAARYLRASGAPKHTPRAVFAYNHDPAYVAAVLRQAGRYARGGFSTTGANTAGQTCTLSSGTSTATGNALVDYAARFKGVPYVWGGESPSGFDCSGLVQYVYARFGIHLPRTADIQAEVGAKMPKTTPLSRLQPGDLVFSYWAGPAGANGIGHVMIYAGGGQMVGAHATAVSFQPLNSFYRSHVYWYTRVTQLANGSARS